MAAIGISGIWRHVAGENNLGRMWHPVKIIGAARRNQ